MTRRINQRRGTPGARVWQRNYWEHIIRNQRALDAIRRYIVYNPLRWAYDRYNPDATAPDPWARAIWDMMRNDARVPPSRNELEGRRMRPSPACNDHDNHPPASR